MVRELRVALSILAGVVGVGGCLSSLDERDLENRNDGGTAGATGAGTSGTGGTGAANGGSAGAGATSGSAGSSSGKGGAAGGTASGGSSGSDSEAGGGGTAGDDTPGSGGTSGDAGRGGSSGTGGTDNAGGDGNTSGNGGSGNASGTGGDGGTAGSAGGASGGTAGAAGSGGTAGSAGTSTLPPIEDGDPGFATRYWDCCKPTCGWTANVPGGTPAHSCGSNDAIISETSQSACSGGTAYACHALSPWAVNEQLAYGYVAVGNAECGRCYEIEFTGSGHFNQSDAGSVAILGKHMFVQTVQAGASEAGQFDLLIPGGGVGLFNACSAQLGVNASELGAQYGGLAANCSNQSSDLATRKSCVRAACADVFGDFPELRAGCDWYVDWLSLADNPNLVYREVDCPAELIDRSGLDGSL
jgi:hypothetical protein